MSLMHPEVLVIGQEYPLPPARATLSKVVSAAQMGLLFVAIGGNFIPAIQQHPLYQRIQDKKLFIFMGGYFGLNFLQSKLSTTGAFEVFLNDRLVFSKIAANRMPSLQEITTHIKH